VQLLAEALSGCLFGRDGRHTCPIRFTCIHLATLNINDSKHFSKQQD
jgi:hypothetical protein